MYMTLQGKEESKMTMSVFVLRYNLKNGKTKRGANLQKKIHSFVWGNILI